MRRTGQGGREPTIALINVVFLMLIFFMVAGTIAAPMEQDLSLVQTEDLDGTTPPDALVIRADGTLRFRGEEIASAEAYAADLPEADRGTLRVVPDRDLPAARLVEIAAALRAAGAERVMVVTERALQ